jgi:hypothetical protein
MSDEPDDGNKTGEQWAAFQKIWTDTFTKMMQLGFVYSPEAAPPDFLKQVRSGIFQALSQSWEQFLRSPQFLESTKKWMEQAVTFRKMSNDFFAKVRHETQGTAREDVDDLLAALQQLEKRVLDRVDELAGQVEELKGRPTRRDKERKAKPRARRKPRK